MLSITSETLSCNAWLRFVYTECPHPLIYIPFHFISGYKVCLDKHTATNENKCRDLHRENAEVDQQEPQGWLQTLRVTDFYVGFGSKLLRLQDYRFRACEWICTSIVCTMRHWLPCVSITCKTQQYRRRNTWSRFLHAQPRRQYSNMPRPENTAYASCTVALGHPWTVSSFTKLKFHKPLWRPCELLDQPLNIPLKCQWYDGNLGILQPICSWWRLEWQEHKIHPRNKYLHESGIW